MSHFVSNFLQWLAVPPVTQFFRSKWFHFSFGVASPQKFLELILETNLFDVECDLEIVADVKTVCRSEERNDWYRKKKRFPFISLQFAEEFKIAVFINLRWIVWKYVTIVIELTLFRPILMVDIQKTNIGLLNI